MVSRFREKNVGTRGTLALHATYNHVTTPKKCTIPKPEDNKYHTLPYLPTQAFVVPSHTSHHVVTLSNWAHVRKLKNQEGSKIYVKVRLLRSLFQRGVQKSTVPLAPTTELNTCKNSSRRRYGKNLCKNLDPTPILARKLRFLRAGYTD
jgi:hypothetical protein